MASAAPPKRMVSSCFITLVSPHRATVTQQQPALQAHSAPARDKQHTAVRVSPSDNIPSLRYKREDHSQSSELLSYGGVDSKGRTHSGASARASDPQSPKPVQPGPSRGKLQEDNRGAAEPLPPPAAPTAPLPSPLGTSFSEESALPPPPPAQTPLSHPVTPGQQPVYNREISVQAAVSKTRAKPSTSLSATSYHSTKSLLSGQLPQEVETSTPSSGLKQDEQSHGIHKNGQDTSRESKEVCGFCRKPVALSEPAIEALNRTYHDGCFQCRSCHMPLAGKHYYNKAGIPLCEDCYQASLELCWACGEAITDHVIRALERAYHPTCFTCATCKQQIGEQPFAQGEVGEVYCLQDYYRKYAPKCNACNQLIIPKEDGTDSYNVECLGRSYHENCYRCEVCVIQLSPEPNEHGCYPLDGRLLCKSCHLSLASGQH